MEMSIRAIFSLVDHSRGKWDFLLRVFSYDDVVHSYEKPCK